MKFSICAHSVVSPADTWYCRITKDICPCQAWVDKQPKMTCKYLGTINISVYGTLFRMTEKEKEYPWEKYTREEKAQINLHRAKLTPEDFEEWYRTRNI